jgi:Peptidase family C25
MRQRLSISVLVDGATVSRSLIVFAIALLILAFSLVALAKGAVASEIAGISVSQSDRQTLRFVYHTAKRAQSLAPGSDNQQLDKESFLVAVPFGSDAQIGFVKPFGVTKAGALLKKTRKIYSSSRRNAPAIAELGGKSSVRGWSIVSVNVRALQNEVVYDSLEIEIQFVPSAEANAISARPGRVAQPGMFGAMFAGTMLNYAEATVWTQSGPLATSAVRSLSRSAAGANPFSQSSDWFKMNITSNGMVRVNGSDLSAAGLSIPINSSRIRVFYDGGEPLPPWNPKVIPDPMDTSATITLNARPTFDELPVKVFDGGDGRLDANDYFIFYGESANHWKYEANKAPKFIRNVFTDNNYYWLTASGSFSTPAERIAVTTGGPVLGVNPLTTVARKVIRIEQDKISSENSSDDIDNYYDWFWSGDDSVGSVFTISNPSTNTAFDLTASYTVHAIAGALSLYVNNQPATATNNGQSELWTFTTGALKNGVNSIRVNQSRFFSRGPYLDYVEIDYLADLNHTSGGLDFYLPYSGFDGDISVSGVPAGVMVWELNDTRRPLEVPADISAGSLTFVAALSATGPNRYYVADISDAIPPLSIERVMTTDLRSGINTQIDYLIVTPRNWTDDLQRYVDYRSAASNVNIKVVAVEDIYDEFSAGRIDPSAIRDFLKFAFEAFPSPAPSTVLFVGDGTYDFRQVGPGSAENRIPPYIRPHRIERDYISDDSYVYFDEFAYLDSDGDYVPDSVIGVDMVPARWPVRTTTELNRVIDKTIDYETTPELGSWRTKVVLLADDEFGSLFVNESVHVTQTEELEINHLPANFLREKIYLWDYQFNSSRERPAVNDAIVRALNKGALVFNYVGHGNLELFAHERVFTTQSDLPRLQNGARLPMVFTASCSIGFFDSPTKEGMAEELLRMKNGSVCVISATRLVYSSANAEFNRVAFDHIFGPQDLSIAQGVFAAKLTRQVFNGSIDNDRRYSCFGDPFLRLAIPEYKIQFTDAPDSIVALQPTTITGNVLDASGSVFTAFNGTAEVTVRDSRAERDHKVLNLQGDVDVNVFYDVKGPVIFRGVTPVVNGTFSVGFIPSLDITFGGASAQISAYASNASTDADGVKDSIPVSSVITSSDDSDGPKITLIFPGRQDFLSGDRISHDEELIVRLEDPSGINLSGAFGHGISFTIDDDQTTQAQLTDSFGYDDGSFSAGELRYTISSSSPGVHQYKIKVWDNANNSSSLEFSAETSLEEAIAIDELLNYPNPMNKDDITSFYFNLQGPAKRVTLQIFTVAGAEVYAAEASNLLANYHSDMFPWNGRDLRGDRVATGVYIYKVVAYPENGSDAVEEFGKLVLMN